MKNKILTSPLFDRRYKRFKKKFPSLESEMIDFLKLLDDNPMMGVLISENTYKVRLASADKNKGRSGGFRVITYLVKELLNSNFEINLLVIYDKSEESSFDKSQIKTLIKKLEL